MRRLPGWLAVVPVAAVVACGGAQRSVTDAPVGSANPDGNVLTGAWCSAEAAPAWLGELLDDGVHQGAEPSPWQPTPDDLGASGLPAVPGEFVSLALIDVDLDGNGELLGTWIGEAYDGGPVSGFGAWRCGPGGWEAVENAASQYMEADSVIRLGRPERVPGATDGATLHIREDWPWTDEAFGVLAHVLFADGYVAPMPVADLSSRVNADPAPGYYGGEPLSASGWMPRLDGEGSVWVAFVVEYGWDIPEDRWDDPTAGDRPEDWTFFQGLELVPVAGSNHGEAPWQTEPTIDPVYVLLGQGEPPARCTSFDGCVTLSEGDRSQLRPHSFTWVRGVWSTLESAVAAWEELGRDDVVVLAADEAIWASLDELDDDPYDNKWPDPALLHPALRTILELEPAWR